MPRLLAIGDIHGHSKAFSSLLNVIRPQVDDTVVLLGDYIDRGPESSRVIDLILALQQETQVVPLRGNHEDMMLKAVGSRDALSFWRDCGGEETLSSYPGKSMAGIPVDHWDFLRSTCLYHETGAFIFVHAFLEPDVPLDSQSEHDLLWRHIEYAPRHFSGKRVICGHTPQRGGLPVHFGTGVCIDTGVHETGWLTCYEPARNRFWQCNDSGESRMDALFFDPD